MNPPPPVDPTITRLCEILGEAGTRCEWPGILSHPDPVDAMGSWKRYWEPIEVDRCEFFPGRSYGEVCHIRARGRGNANRDDSHGNLAIMCQRHHNMFDRVLGQSPRNQRWLREAVRKSRGDWINSQLDEHTASLKPSKD